MALQPDRLTPTIGVMTPGKTGADPSPRLLFDRPRCDAQAIVGARACCSAEFASSRIRPALTATCSSCSLSSRAIY